MYVFVQRRKFIRCAGDKKANETTFVLAGAMPFVDTEPLDGVDYANGVLGYITLVCHFSKSRQLSIFSGENLC